MPRPREGPGTEGMRGGPSKTPPVQSADLHRWPQAEEFQMSLVDSPRMDPNPVFVDRFRWRRPTLRWLGVIVAVVLAAYLWVVGLAFLSTVKVPPERLSDNVGNSSPGPDEPGSRQVPHPTPWRGFSARRFSSTVPTSIVIASSAGGIVISISCGSDTPDSG